jgi:hypothetical protein
VHHRELAGKLRDGSIEQSERALDVSAALVNRGCAQADVGHLGRAATKERHSPLVAALRIADRAQDELGLRLQRAGLHLRQIMSASEAFLGFDGQKRGALTRADGAVERVERAFDIALLCASLGEIDEQERAQRRVLRELGARRDGSFGEREIGQARRDELEREPDRSIVRRLFAGLEQRLFGAVEITLEIHEKGRLIDERPRALARRVADAGKALQNLSEIFVRLSPFDDRDQSLEWLTKIRVDVDRGEVIARRRGLVSDALFEHTELVEQDSLSGRRAREVVFRAQPPDGGTRVAFFGC